MKSIKSIKDTINKGLLEDVRILNCFSNTDLIKKTSEYMYKNVWDYMIKDNTLKTSVAPTIEYDIAYDSVFGINDDKGYSAYFIISVPAVEYSNEVVSVDDLSEIILEIAKSKFDYIRNIKNIPIGYDNGCILRRVSFCFNSKE